MVDAAFRRQAHPVVVDVTAAAGMTSGAGAVAPDMAQVTMYTTTWCGYCFRLKSQLKRAGVAYDEIDIEEQPDAADLVAKINNGNQTVPTLVFTDGSALTNPSVAQIEDRLASLV